MAKAQQKYEYTVTVRFYIPELGTESLRGSRVSLTKPINCFGLVPENDAAWDAYDKHYDAKEKRMGGYRDKRRAVRGKDLGLEDLPGPKRHQQVFPSGTHTIQIDQPISSPSDGLGESALPVRPDHVIQGEEVI